MITGWDRVAAAASGASCDRIPVFCNLFDQGPRLLGLSARRYFQSGAAVAEAQLRLRERYDYDNVWSLFYVGKEAELLGCTDILFRDDGPPNVADFIIKEPRDIDALRVPEDIAGHPAFREEMACLRILKAEAGGRYPICAYITAATSLPAILMGMEKWFELLLLGPTDLRDRLLEKCSDFVQRHIAAYRAAGADCLVYSSGFTSTDFVPLSFIREIALPWMERDLAPGGTADMVYYCGMSRVTGALPLVLDRWTFAAVYCGPHDDIVEVKRLAAGRAITAAPINDILFAHRSEEEVRREVRRVVAAGKPGGRFLVGSSAMPLAIPEGHIRAMIETARECGRWEPAS